jgi:dihydrofolate reductase
MISDNPLLEFTNSLEDALEMVKDQDEVWIIGGAQVYNEALEKNLIDRLCISEVDYDGKADTFINVDKINYDNFEVTEEEVHESYTTEKGKVIPAWTFKRYSRKE